MNEPKAYDVWYFVRDRPTPRIPDGRKSFQKLHESKPGCRTAGESRYECRCPVAEQPSRRRDHRRSEHKMEDRVSCPDVNVKRYAQCCTQTEPRQQPEEEHQRLSSRCSSVPTARRHGSMLSSISTGGLDGSTVSMASRSLGGEASGNGRSGRVHHRVSGGGGWWSWSSCVDCRRRGSRHFVESGSRGMWW